ncbi:MAG: hypothetical protein HQK51_08800 [Oligoflexia bacterium]|nr:hypothetical protein [Oligoflexia bacterium]
MNNAINKYKSSVTTNNRNNKDQKDQQKDQKECEVLYQKLGERWYVFSEDEDGEVIFSAIPTEIDPRKNKFKLYNIIEEKNNNKNKNKIRSPRTAEKLEADSL